MPLTDTTIDDGCLSFDLDVACSRKKRGATIELAGEMVDPEGPTKKAMICFTLQAFSRAPSGAIAQQFCRQCAQILLAE